MSTAAATRKIRETKTTIPLGRCYIVVGPNVWGKAFTVRQAWENAQKPQRFIVYDAPPDCIITEMGDSEYRPSLYYTPDEELAPGTEFVPIGYAAKELYRFPDEEKKRS